MSKYIEVEKLKVEIKGLQCEQGFEDGETERGYQVAIKDILRVITSLQQDEIQVNKMLCSQVWWEEQGWIMIPPNATIKGIDSLLKQVRKKLQQEQPESSKGKFVFPNFLYARTVDNKTIDVSYAPQSLDAVEYIKNDSTEQPGADLNEEVERFAKECGYPSAATIDFQFAYHFYELGRNSK